MWRGGGVIEDETYLMSITDKISLALKFELREIFGKQESALLDKQETLLDRGVALQ